MEIEGIDHLVLTVRDIAVSCDFYSRVLGMEVVTFAGGRKALGFGRNKINLHQHGQELEPKAAAAIPGSADICLITSTRPESVLAQLREAGVSVIEGPVPRTGALGPVTSVYFRDPDANLIEVASYDEA